MAWVGFNESVVGDGAVTYFANNTAVRLKSTLTTSGNRAFLAYEVRATPGITVEVTFSARITENADGGNAPRFIIDWPSGQSPVTSTALSGEWQEYRLSYTVPFTSNPDGGDFVRCAFGVFTSNSGEVEFTRPLFSTKFSEAPSVRIVESGSSGGDSWVRFSDGTQIVRGKVTISPVANEATDAIFTYPVPFSSPPIVVATTEAKSAVVTRPAMLSSTPTTTQCVINIIRTNTTSTTNHVTAHGFWL